MPSTESIVSFSDVRVFLDKHRAVYTLLHHPPTRTSEESARARGEDLSVGGKAILLKVDDRFVLFVLSASLKIDSKKIKARFGARNLRFATSEELRDLTGLEPGAVPPFGRPVLPFELFVDESITGNRRIAFNAASLTDSIIMETAEYLRVAPHTEFNFSRVENERSPSPRAFNDRYQ